MFQKELFDQAVKNSGLKIGAIQLRMGMSHNVWRSRTLGFTEFTASEILALCTILNLNKTQRENIFGI